MKTSETTAEIFKALTKFRKQLKQPLKDADNPFFKSKYVPLENVVTVIDEALDGTGLSYSQEVLEGDNASIVMSTIIMHESGEWIVLEGAVVRPTKQDPQGVGSAITYARRYSLSVAFGVASDPDDDGNQASAAAPVKQPKITPKKQTPAKQEKSLEERAQDVIKWANNKYHPAPEMLTEWAGMKPEDVIKAVQAYHEEQKA